MIARRRPAAEQDQPGSDQRSVPRRGARRSHELARRLGRLVLWAFIALVLARGLGAILTAPRQAATSASQVATAGQGDLAAESFAVSFARAYLSFRPGHTADRTRVVDRFLASGLGDRAAAVLPLRGPGQQVAQATVARVSSLGDARALITVASSFTDPKRPPLYLTVPVARDASGGLAVFDLPGLSAPPPRGSVVYEDPPPLSGPYAPEIGQLLARFLPIYIDGKDPSALAYLTAPGVSLSPLGGGLALASVESLGQDSEPSATSGVLLAAVHVRDARSGAVYPLRYRIGLAHRDRWYVSSVDGGPQS